jgi:hypothetical protein
MMERQEIHVLESEGSKQRERGSFLSVHYLRGMARETSLDCYKRFVFIKGISTMSRLNNHTDSVTIERGRFMTCTRALRSERP